MRTAKTFTLLIILTFTHSINLANADELPTQDTLSAIGQFADTICTKVPLAGADQSIELSGEVKAELKAFFKKIGDAGVKGQGKLNAASWEGLLQKDLTDIISKNMDCRLQLAEKMIDRLFSTPKKK
ncbi:MAG: hypothetical protein Q3M24_01715 [Candidatus Electrothrix aestuarii]|uniref:Uncharacterized protein n=1 Tax=Candidatus Electrothrix aestuarii TaxID=3062594 RepID=A0AAU8LX86_9BACT|nr:hypothetical protein [Candidatus Electrothrix aestuarii]